MRRFAVFVCFCAVLFGQLALTAQTSDSNQKSVGTELPTVLLAGLQAYKDKGPEEAVRLWIKDGPVDGSKDALSQANNLRRVQDFYGAYRGFDLAGARTLSRRARIFYLVMNFDKGPLFVKFLVYRSEEGWVLTTFDFNTKEDAVFPSEVGIITRP